MDDALKDLTSQKSQPLLTAEQERYLFSQLWSGGQDALEARVELLKHNIGLVVSIAKSYKTPYTEDLVGEGMFGLNRAITRFNPKLGFKFSTYATHWIREAIDRAIINIYNQRNVTRLPVYMHDALKKMNRLLENSPGLEGNAKALSEQLDLTITRTRLVMDTRRKGLTALSLDAPLRNRQGSLKELIPEPQPDERRLELATMILELMTEQEAKILWLTCVEQLSNSEAAQVLGIKEAVLRNLKGKVKKRVREKYPNIALILLNP
ncbi:MAG: sigma-70 family RNA polymerase sigma factor [Patescibacteria group bacterium]